LHGGAGRNHFALRWTGSLRTIEREFARAPEDIRRRIRWLPIGTAVELAA
jgi:hypothetical protein